MDTSYYKKYEPIFGEWKIVREIGEGSFGKVFEIEREDFGYTYKAALKAITIPQSKSEIKSALSDGMDEESASTYFRGFVEEMVGEFVTMSTLKGISNIVSYEDHKVIPHKDGIGWDILIRMELLTPLIDRVQANPLSREDVIKLGIDMCKALEACRTYQIIHRDIKPENIFVSKLGDYKLGDFGIAKTVEKTMGGLSKKGTYTYMAPEVYKGEKYGASVDIYSLGIVLYRYMNNSRAPFLPEYPLPIKYTDRDTALQRRISGETLPEPVNADTELAEIILKACAYKPEDRYASPTEMREALVALPNKSTEAIEAAAEEITAINVSLAPSEKPTAAESAVPVKAPMINVYEAEDISEESEETLSIFAGKATPCKETNLAENDFSGETAVLCENDEGTVILDGEEILPEDAGESEEPPEAKTSTAVKESSPNSKKAENESDTSGADAIAVLAAVISIIGIITGSATIAVLASIVFFAAVIRIFTVSKSVWTDIIAISVGDRHTVGLKSDGTVVAAGYNYYGQCKVEQWSDIIAISAGDHHTVGLKSDGTVVAAGDYEKGQCDVKNWSDIVTISAGDYHTVGLKSDGTVVAAGNNDDGQCSVEAWAGIESISAGNNHTVGLKSDGTVVVVGNNEKGQCGAERWTNIDEISAGRGYTVGLKSNGTVVAVGDNEKGQCNVEDWTDIIAISAGDYHTVGLKSDGTVVAVGDNEYGQCDVEDWTDIVAISAGGNHTVGLKSDGTVVAVGYNKYGQCNVG